MTTDIMSSTATVATSRDASLDTSRPPTSAGSANSALSEASSKASSHLSKSSGYTTSSTATTGNSSKPRSKAPTLDAIAARMKKNHLADKQDGAAIENAQVSNTDGKASRLMLPGRLQSTLSESSDSSLNIMNPAPIAHGEPPKVCKDIRDFAASPVDTMHRSRSVSPTKPQSIAGKTPVSATSSQEGAESIKSASSTSTMTREMPSLQDIIDRMSKKGISSSTSSSNKEKSGSTESIPAKKIEKTTLNNHSPPSEATQAPTTLGTKNVASVSMANVKLDSDKEAEAQKDKGHPLQHKWTMYFDSKSWNPSTNASTETPGSPLQSSSHPANSWEAALKMLGVYTTVESFMSIFSTLRRPSQLERNSNYHLFKNGIKPMWEDPANKDGGKWIVTLKGTNTALLDRSWMWLVLALIGEELDDNDDVTGAVVSTRSKGDRIALWIRNKNDVDLVNKIGKKFVLLLDLEKEPGISLEFSPNSLNDGSNRKGTPSRFISLNNAPNFTSPVFSQASLAPTSHQINRLHVSSNKGGGAAATSTGPGNNSRMAPIRRGSEQGAESHHSATFPMGLGGSIGRTSSPSPARGSSTIGIGGLMTKSRLT